MTTLTIFIVALLSADAFETVSCRKTGFAIQICGAFQSIVHITHVHIYIYYLYLL